MKTPQLGLLLCLLTLQTMAFAINKKDFLLSGKLEGLKMILAVFMISHRFSRLLMADLRHLFSIKYLEKLLIEHFGVK